jgi:hypothetical protein
MITKIFEEKFQKDAAANRFTVSKRLSDHAQMGVNVPLVYIYSLVGKRKINYPRKDGKSIYIGETCRQNGSWRRFQPHISKSLAEGLNTQINHSLSIYYHTGEKLNLRIFAVNEGYCRKDIERVLLRSHLWKFGALPIGQGGTGRSNTPQVVMELVNEREQLHDAAARLLR